MIVVTLTKVPPALRGDLTKWYQEIQTGVYVGNVSARIRDLLWDRIQKTIGQGEATMVYSINNEIGYDFKTTRQDRRVVDFDGLPLMMHLTQSSAPPKLGFSKAAKFHRAKVMTHQRLKQKATTSVQPTNNLRVAALDLETTGLDSTKDAIISIGAVKRVGKKTERFSCLVQTNCPISEAITALTDITGDQLESQGVSLATALTNLRLFLQDVPVIGYHVTFDEHFLSAGCRQTAQPQFTNQFRDLMPIVKDVQSFLDNYKLATVLAAYQITNVHPHHALSDAEATLELADKLMENGSFKL